MEFYALIISFNLYKKAEFLHTTDFAFVFKKGRPIPSFILYILLYKKYNINIIYIPFTKIKTHFSFEICLE